MRSQPSYHQRYARTIDPRWKGLRSALVPALGPTGNIIKDVSGFKKDATLENMDPDVDWGVDEKGYALLFDGVDDRVNLGDDRSFTDAISIFAYIKTPSLTTGFQDSGWMAREAAAGAPFVSWALRMAGDDFILEPSFLLGISGSLESTGSAAALLVSTIYSVLGTWKSGDFLRFYTNGVETAASASTQSGTISYGDFNNYLGWNEIDDEYAATNIYASYMFDRQLNASDALELHYDYLAPVRAKRRNYWRTVPAAAPGGRVMSSLVRHGGLAAAGGLAGPGGGLAA